MFTLLTAALLAVVHQYLFYDLEFGVSYPVFVILFYCFIYIFARDRIRTLTIVDAWIATVILLLSLTYLLFDNVLFQVLNFMVIPGLMMLHLAYAVGRKKRPWWELGLIVTAIDHVLPQTVRHWRTVGSIIPPEPEGGKWTTSRKAIISKVLIGLLASLPILFVVLTLLSSTDGVFNAYLSGFPNARSTGAPPMLPRLIWIIICSRHVFQLCMGICTAHTV